MTLTDEVFGLSREAGGASVRRGGDNRPSAFRLSAATQLDRNYRNAFIREKLDKYPFTRP